MMGVGTAEMPVLAVAILAQFVLPLVLMCVAAYFGARKGAERALRGKRDDDKSSE